MTEQIITKESLNKLFDYKDGELYWKIKTSKKVVIGSKAGSTRADGYTLVRINNKRYYYHRLIFLMHNGYLPDFLDHIDNDKSNNRIENLREATLMQNAQNVKLGKDNTSGIKNVSWSKMMNKWVVKIRINREKKHLGYYADINLAELVAIEAREKFHGNFANNG